MNDTIWKPVPRSVRKALEERGVPVQDICSLSVADMNNDGGLQNIYLLLTKERLYFAVSDQSGEMTYAGAVPPKRRQSEGIAELHTYPLSRLNSPKILNQVVGGLLTVDLDGEETWLCRFSGTKMHRMQRFCEDMQALIRSEPLKERENDGEEYCPQCGAPYPERGRAVCPKCMEKHTVFVRILQYFKNYKLRVAVMLTGVTISGLANAVWPYLSGSVLYDQVLGGGGELAEKLGIPGNAMLLLLILVLTMAGTHFIRHLTGIIHGRMTAFMVPDIVCKLKQRVFDSLKNLSVGFFTRRQTGSLMQRVNGDANEVMGFFIDGLPYFLFNIVTIALSVGVMFSMNWKLALVAIAMLPPAAIVCYVIGPRYWHATGRRARTVRAMYSLLNDDIVGARVVKAFGQEKSENKRFDKVNERVRAAEMRVVHYGNQYDIAYSLTRDIPNLLVWSVGALILLNTPGNFTYGELLTFVSYLTMLQGPLEFFSDVFRWWASSMNSAQRVFEIIDSNPEIQERENPLHMDIQGEVELRNVSFSYEPNKPVLKDINFHIRAGEMLGIVGKSGAGKSTLVNLISRLYDPDDGTVLLDGEDVKDISFASLRGAVAMVSQETYIFMGTVAENIAYARPDASREEIVRAAIAASAHGFICRLPDGYDTVIGSGGRELSGGERQRVSIARAILADPKILVLDEATASVDTETERAIQASLEKLIQNRTTISIAHRLSTLRSADRLIVLDNGKLVESGTHEELVKQRGVYYKLLQLQSKALAMRGIE